MSIPVSTIPAAKSWIVDQVTATVNDVEVQVARDYPGTYTANDVIVIGQVAREVSVSHMVGSGGAGWLDERYTIEVQIGVYRGGDDNATGALVEARAFDLLAVVESAVRTDPSLGGNVAVARPMNVHASGEPEEKGHGRVYRLTLMIDVQARI